MGGGVSKPKRFNLERAKLTEQLINVESDTIIDTLLPNIIAAYEKCWLLSNKTNFVDQNETQANKNDICQTISETLNKLNAQLDDDLSIVDPLLTLLNHQLRHDMLYDESPLSPFDGEKIIYWARYPLVQNKFLVLINHLCEKINQVSDVNVKSQLQAKMLGILVGCQKHCYTQKEYNTWMMRLEDSFVKIQDIFHSSKTFLAMIDRCHEIQKTQDEDDKKANENMLYAYLIALPISIQEPLLYSILTSPSDPFVQRLKMTSKAGVSIPLSALMARYQLIRDGNEWITKMFPPLPRSFSYKDGIELLNIIFDRPHNQQLTNTMTYDKMAAVIDYLASLEAPLNIKCLADAQNRNTPMGKFIFDANFLSHKSIDINTWIHFQGLISEKYKACSTPFFQQNNEPTNSHKIAISSEIKDIIMPPPLPSTSTGILSYLFPTSNTTEIAVEKSTHNPLLVSSAGNTPTNR